MLVLIFFHKISRQKNFRFKHSPDLKVKSCLKSGSKLKFRVEFDTLSLKIC